MLRKLLGWAIGVLIWLALVGSFPQYTGWIILVTFALGIWFIRSRSKSKGRKKSRGHIEESNRLALEQFGTTTEERVKGIDTFFDEKTGSLSATIRNRTHNHYWVERATMDRPLSAMSGREREALRASFQLANIGEFGESINFYLSRAELIFGDGKALITDTGECKRWRSGQSESWEACPVPEALKGCLDSAESAVSHVLLHVGNTFKRLPDHPVLKRLNERLIGGGAESLSSVEGLTGLSEDMERPALVLGDSVDTGKLVRFDGEGSAITVAPPGSGKTQCHVFPTMLTWKGPAVVLDVKGEIYAGTSKWRAENVGPVYKFSPLDPEHSHKYSPLTLVRSDPDYLWEDSRFLADMMMIPTGAGDPFWENRARDVLTAAIARSCLTDDPAKRSMESVIDVFHGVGWDKFTRDLQARVDIRSMTRAGTSLGEMERKTRDSVLQTGLSSLSAWDGDRIARSTVKSDWSPVDLRNGSNATVYICLKPNEVESYISILRVFIAQHIRALTSVLPPRGAAPILFMLDELPRLRQMPPVEEALEIGRQYGIKLWMFTQSVGQLKNAYSNGDGMLGSCAVRMYMNPSLHDATAQKLSDDIGFQESVLDGTRQKIVEPAVLAGPDYKDYVIVMAGGAKPFRVKKHFAWQDQELAGRMGSL